ncbi:MAG: hypothetical protein EOO10_02490 [Chitinophagaceae bacterium]|nr:MAG: hypothetical protein EOO10_02490 [Chitinophagaceae bacterium]
MPPERPNAVAKLFYFSYQLTINQQVKPLLIQSVFQYKRRNIFSFTVLTCLILLFSSCKKEGTEAPAEGIPGTQISQPLITSLSLSEGVAGETLHLAGRGFGTSLSEVVVLVDTAQAKITSLTPEKISITLPDLTPGKKAIQVKVKGVGSNVKEFLQVGPSGEAGNSGYYLSRGNIELHYQSSTMGGLTTNYKTFLKGISDSIGSKLYRLRTVLPDAGTVDGAVMVNSNKTIYVGYKDGGMQTIEDIIKSDPNLVSFSMTGMPSSITMNAVPTLNSEVSFSAPIRIAYQIVMGTLTVTSDMTVTSSNGRVLAFEDVQTPGGAFTNCVKWSYHIKREDKGTAAFSAEEDITLWYAKGIGLVKSISTGNSGTTTTVLTDVKNKVD